MPEPLISAPIYSGSSTDTKEDRKVTGSLTRYTSNNNKKRTQVYVQKAEQIHQDKDQHVNRPQSSSLVGQVPTENLQDQLMFKGLNLNDLKHHFTYCYGINNAMWIPRCRSNNLWGMKLERDVNAWNLHSLISHARQSADLQILS